MIINKNVKRIKIWILTLSISFLSMILSSCQSTENTRVALKGPLLAVLCRSEQGPKWKGVLTPSAVYIINLESYSIIHRIATRSPADDFTIGPFNKLYISNSGGLGNEVDTAIAVIDPRRGELERYINLDIIPGSIAATDTDLFINSGLFFPKTEEITWNKINPENNEIITFRMPGVTSAPIYHDNKIFVSTTIKSSYYKKDFPLSVHQFAPDLVPPDEAVIKSLLVLNPSTLEVKTVIDKEGYFGRKIGFDEEGNAFGLISRSGRRGITKDTIVIFLPEEHRIKKVVTLPTQSEPAGRLIIHMDRLYVSYYDSNSMKGDKVVIYDTKDFHPVKVIEGLHGPVDMLIEEGKLFVLCNGNSNKTDGEVVVVDIEKQEIISRIQVGRIPKKLEYIPID
ncbi:MAG: hypothetical protein K6T65_08255 [Peptococcaceae bacterium]|nr:hypothetical protein [Peptococcaceae bacterium]